MEKCHCSGTAMCADGGRHIVNNNSFNTETFFYKLRNKLCILGTIGMRNEDNIVTTADTVLSHVFNKRSKCFFTSAYIGKRYQMSFVIDMKNRFYVDKTSENGDGAGNSAALVKEIKVVNSKLMTYM